MIETPRLRLRPGEERDVAGLVAGLNDWAVAQWVLRPPFPYGEADAREFIAKTRMDDAAPGLGFFVIAERRTDALLGVVSLDLAGDRAELGYWMLPSAQRRGYMREASLALLRHGARHLDGAATIFATTDAENIPSQTLLLSLGFVLVATTPRASGRRGPSVGHLYELPAEAMARLAL